MVVLVLALFRRAANARRCEVWAALAATPLADPVGTGCDAIGNENAPELARLRAEAL